MVESSLQIGLCIITIFFFFFLACLLPCLNHWTGKQHNQKQISDLAFHLIFHNFSPFNCCLSVVL